MIHTHFASAKFPPEPLPSHDSLGGGSCLHARYERVVMRKGLCRRQANVQRAPGGYLGRSFPGRLPGRLFGSSFGEVAVFLHVASLFGLESHGLVVENDVTVLCGGFLAFFDLRVPRLSSLAQLWPLMHGQGSTAPQALPSTPHARRVGREIAVRNQWLEQQRTENGTPHAFLDLEGHHELVVMCRPCSS